MATDEVTVRVPVERLAEFYGFYAAWLSAEPGKFLIVPTTAPTTTKPWMRDDKDVFLALRSGLSRPASAVLQALIAQQAGQPLTWDQLAMKATLGTQAAVAAALGELRSRSIASGKQPIVVGGPETEGTSFLLEENVRTLMTTAWNITA